MVAAIEAREDEGQDHSSHRHASTHGQHQVCGQQNSLDCPHHSALFFEILIISTPVYSPVFGKFSIRFLLIVRSG